MTEYEQGFQDAFDVIADYVEKEVCIVTGSMIRRMKHELWRFDDHYKGKSASAASDSSDFSDGKRLEGCADSLEHE